MELMNNQTITDFDKIFHTSSCIKAFYFFATFQILLASICLSAINMLWYVVCRWSIRRKKTAKTIRGMLFCFISCCVLVIRFLDANVLDAYSISITLSKHKYSCNWIRKLFGAVRFIRIFISNENINCHFKRIHRQTLLK